jgi:hypothetical protein
MTDYQIVGVRADVVSWIAREPLAAAIWNLYWLSEPQLDALPGAGMRWINRFRPQAGGLAAVIRDVNQDPLLARKLQEPPGQFLSWFETEDATIFAIVNRRDGAIPANLQGPIVMNAASRTGIQLVLSDRTWSTRHELVRLPGAAAAKTA